MVEDRLGFAKEERPDSDGGVEPRPKHVDDLGAPQERQVTPEAEHTPKQPEHVRDTLFARAKRRRSEWDKGDPSSESPRHRRFQGPPRRSQDLHRYACRDKGGRGIQQDGLSAPEIGVLIYEDDSG